MRVVDLDRDMRDVIPTGSSLDTDFLFKEMTDRTLDLASRDGGRVLDVASGLGQDARALADRTAIAVAAEPSARMSALARMVDAASEGPGPTHVRGWADALPFATGTFDAVFCKGAIDHFDAPERAIAEMARVTKPNGRVVLAIANFDSLSCRVSRASDALREDWLGWKPPRGRRHYDVPHDHFTRYELGLMREQAEQSLELEVVKGISLAWGLRSWARLLGRLPRSVAQAGLVAFDRVAGTWPSLADVVVLAGRPRSRASSA